LCAPPHPNLTPSSTVVEISSESTGFDNVLRVRDERGRRDRNDRLGVDTTTTTALTGPEKNRFFHTLVSSREEKKRAPGI